jgi:hypothetical protein
MLIRHARRFLLYFSGALFIIPGGIVLGRLLSLVAGHDFSFAASNAIFELIMAALCYYESRQGLERH